MYRNVFDWYFLQEDLECVQTCSHLENATSKYSWSDPKVAFWILICVGFFARTLYLAWKEAKSFTGMYWIIKAKEEMSKLKKLTKDWEKVLAYVIKLFIFKGKKCRARANFKANSEIVRFTTTDDFYPCPNPPEVKMTQLDPHTLRLSWHSSALDRTYAIDPDAVVYYVIENVQIENGESTSNWTYINTVGYFSTLVYCPYHFQTKWILELSVTHFLLKTPVC